MRKIFLCFIMLVFCLSLIGFVEAGYESQYPPEQSGTYVKATTNSADTDYRAWHTTNPAKSLVGSSATNEWQSLANVVTNQRFHIDLGSAKIIKRIYYENSHSSGLNTNAGVKDFTFWGSNNSGSFDNLTYEADSNWTQLEVDKLAFDIHAQYSDNPDPKYVAVTNDISYRYYAFKFANNWGRTSYMSVRRIELQIYLPDFIAPKYSNNFTDAVFADSNILHSLKWEDDTWLSGYIFSFDNGSGNFVNDSWVAFSTNPAWSNVYKTINSTGGAIIRWCVYANDTSFDVAGGNWNLTSCENPFSYITVDKSDLKDCYELNKVGIYNLTADINKNISICMNISANSVTLDCGGHIISGIDSGIGVNINRPSLVYTNVHIKNCVISDWDTGIFGNRIETINFENIILNSNNYGIYFFESDVYNLININLSLNNYGIYFSNTDTGFITNVISNLNNYGIYFITRADESILTNINLDSDGYGIYWDDSSTNILKDSKIINSTFFGIYLINPNLRGINNFYNNFLNNTDNIYIYGGGLNNWNTTKQIGTRIYGDGTEIGGNFYANLNGTGFSEICDDVEIDGFCDDYYNISENNIDYLPLTEEEPIPSIWFESGTAENNATLTQNFIYVDWDYNMSGWDYERVITILWNESMGELGDMCHEYNPDIKNCTIEILTSGKYFYKLEMEYNNFTNRVHSEMREINLEVLEEEPEASIWFETGTELNNATKYENLIYIDWDYNLSGFDYSRVAVMIWRDEYSGEPYIEYGEFNPDIKNHTFTESEENTTPEDYGKYFYILELDYDNNTRYTFSELREINLVEPEEELEEETIEQKLNIQNRIVFLITILLVTNIAIFLFIKIGKKGMSKIGKSKLSIYLIMLFVLSLKVLAVEYDYVRENALLNIVTIFLILGVLYFMYHTFFKSHLIF